MPPDVVLLLLRLALTVLLYVFFAAVFLMLRRDLRAAASEVAARERRYGRLVVVAPEDDEALPAGTSFPLLPVTSLGRAPTNTVTLSDGYASSEHALLLYRGGQWWLQDQGSRNGTMLNGTPVKDAVVVSGGDIIGVGRVQLKLELE